MKRELARIQLDVEDTPKEFLNILPHLKNPLPPPINPATEAPVSPDALMALFPKECVMQEVSSEKTIAIPSEVREILMRSGRPPELLPTPAKRTISQLFVSFEHDTPRALPLGTGILRFPVGCGRISRKAAPHDLVVRFLRGIEDLWFLAAVLKGKVE